MHTFDLSLQDPTGKNWKTAIYRYANDPAAAIQLNLVGTFVKQKIHQVGDTQYTATVTKVTKVNVEIQACVDDRDVDVINDSGQSVAGPGPRRFIRQFSVAKYPSDQGGWLLNYTKSPDPAKPC